MGVAARKKNKRGLRFGANGTPSLIHSSTEPPRVRKPGRALKRRGVKSSRSATNDAATRLVEDIGHAPHETPRDLGGCPTLPAVGQRVRVLWDGMGMWYAGTVRGVKASTGEVLVVYDDGDEEWEALRAGSGTTWTFAGDAAEPADGRDGMLLTACMDRRAWTEMSIRVLRETGTWMSARGIIEAAVSQGWCVCNPDQVPQRLRSLLYDLAFRCDDPIFARQAKGIYGLAEWMLDGDCPAAAVGAGGPGGGGLAPGHNTHSIQPTDVLVPSHPRQCRDDIVGVDVVGGGVVGGVGLEDYGDLPTWGPDNKAVRGPAPSLLRQTPTAHEAIAGGYEYSEGEARSDDDDLFGDDRKWAIDLPDAQSLAPAGLAEEASTARMLDASAAAGHGLSCPLDLEVSPEEVADRISQVCEFVAACIDERRLPSISLRSGTASRPAFTMESNAAIVRFSRMMMALDIIHENLYGECTDGNSGITRITQRDLYYIARSRSSTIKAPQMMQTVQDVSLMLNVPRFAMGIDCRSKGMVYGPITLGGAVSCMRPRGSPISGSVPEIMDISSVNMEDVSAIVVVEKESVFQRLVREAPSHPVLSTCVIITGCGYPDVGTRAFLFRIVGQDRSIPVVGLVDWNASGAHILSQYRYGSKRSLESQAFCVPSLRWLGLRSETLEGLVRNAGPDHTTCFSDCTSRDLALAKSMRGRLHDYGNEAWMAEVQCMEYGLKADLEATYDLVAGGARGFCDLLGELIVREDYI